MRRSVTSEPPVSPNRCGYTARVSLSSPACVRICHICCLFLCLSVGGAVLDSCVSGRCGVGDICVSRSGVDNRRSVVVCGNSEEALHGAPPRRKPQSASVLCVKDTRCLTHFAKLTSAPQLKAVFSLSARTFQSRTPSVNNTSPPVGPSVVRNSDNTPLGAVTSDLRQVSARFFDAISLHFCKWISSPREARLVYWQLLSRHQFRLRVK